jgi:hypothetical protein
MTGRARRATRPTCVHFRRRVGTRPRLRPPAKAWGAFAGGLALVSLGRAFGKSTQVGRYQPAATYPDQGQRPTTESIPTRATLPPSRKQGAAVLDRKFSAPVQPAARSWAIARNYEAGGFDTPTISLCDFGGGNFREFETQESRKVCNRSAAAVRSPTYRHRIRDHIDHHMRYVVPACGGAIGILHEFQ